MDLMTVVSREDWGFPPKQAAFHFTGQVKIGFPQNVRLYATELAISSFSSITMINYV